MCWTSLYTRNKTNTNKIKKHTQHNMWLDISMHKKQDEYKQNKKNTHNTICVGHHYAQTNTYNVNKTWVLLQAT